MAAEYLNLSNLNNNVPHLLKTYLYQNQRLKKQKYRTRLIKGNNDKHLIKYFIPLRRFPPNIRVRVGMAASLKIRERKVGNFS